MTSNAPQRAQTRPSYLQEDDDFFHSSMGDSKMSAKIRFEEPQKLANSRLTSDAIRQLAQSQPFRRPSSASRSVKSARSTKSLNRSHVQDNPYIALAYNVKPRNR